MFKAKKDFTSDNIRVRNGDLYELEAIYAHQSNVNLSQVELMRVGEPLLLTITHYMFNKYFEEVE